MADTRDMRLGSGNAVRFRAGGGLGRSLGMAADTTAQMVRRVRKGFPFAALVYFRKRSGLAMGTIADLMQLPQRTLMRRKAGGRLRPDESERLLRIAGVFDAAVELFEGDADSARRWLTTPSKELDNNPPIEFARTEIGAREVEDLIGRLGYGVFA